jgi:hypothetical protein
LVGADSGRLVERVNRADNENELTALRGSARGAAAKLLGNVAFGALFPTCNHIGYLPDTLMVVIDPDEESGTDR